MAASIAFAPTTTFDAYVRLDQLHGRASSVRKSVTTARGIRLVERIRRNMIYSNGAGRTWQKQADPKSKTLKDKADFPVPSICSAILRLFQPRQGQWHRQWNVALFISYLYISARVSLSLFSPPGKSISSSVVLLCELYSLCWSRAWMSILLILDHGNELIRRLGVVGLGFRGTLEKGRSGSRSEGVRVLEAENS
ncbi:hypothetical protein BDV97DRAFT_222539 [Delphinella strobiligena]|nr:hypothetical protein BDV97DRAFT_222539 [Delphinella strobiligena]